MTLVHIVLFEFKPSTESHVIQDVSSRVMAGHARGDGDLVLHSMTGK